MTAASRPESASGSGALSVGRLVTFSDAVFAIAITLLALQLRVPSIKDPKSASQLSHALSDNHSEFFTYGLTFAIIGLYWLAHHRSFQYIVKSDRRLAELNLLFLLTISFLPFPADLLGHYSDNRTAVIFYAASLAATSLMSLALWLYAVHAHLTTADLDRRESRYLGLRAAVPAAVFLASIPLAFVSLSTASSVWFLAFIGLILLRHRSPHPED